MRRRGRGSAFPPAGAGAGEGAGDGAGAAAGGEEAGAGAGAGAAAGLDAGACAAALSCCFPDGFFRACLRAACGFFAAGGTSFAVVSLATGASFRAFAALASASEGAGAGAGAGARAGAGAGVPAVGAGAGAGADVGVGVGVAACGAPAFSGAAFFAALRGFRLAVPAAFFAVPAASFAALFASPLASAPGASRSGLSFWVIWRGSCGWSCGPGSVRVPSMHRRARGAGAGSARSRSAPAMRRVPACPWR